MCILSRAWRVHCMSRCFRLIEQPAGGGRTRHTGAPSLRPVTVMLAQAAARLLPASAAETGAPPPTSSQLAHSTFLATDAQPIVHQATGAADAPWLRDAFGAVFVQRFSRGKYDPFAKACGGMGMIYPNSGLVMGTRRGFEKLVEQSRRQPGYPCCKQLRPPDDAPAVRGQHSRCGSRRTAAQNANGRAFDPR